MNPRTRLNIRLKLFGLAGLAVAVPGLSSCGGGGEEPGGSAGGTYAAEQVAEALYTVLKSDRKVYASKIVTRLAKEEKVIEAHEEWKENKALLLPAQMFREGAEEVDAAEKPFEFSYSLQSLWPLNYENAKKQTRRSSPVSRLSRILIVSSTARSGSVRRSSAGRSISSASTRTGRSRPPAGPVTTIMRTGRTIIRSLKRTT